MELPNNTELRLRVATLYKNGNNGSCKLQMRVLPDMLGWKESELPWYPMFSATQDLHGCSEFTGGSQNKATKYWVACTSDYKTGFVITEASSESHTETKKTNSNDSWPFTTFYTHMGRCGLDTSRVKYNELKVLYKNTNLEGSYDKTSSGTLGFGAAKPTVCLIVTNVKSGDIWIMHGSGTTVYIGSGKIYLRAGSPNASHSLIEMTPNQIHISADDIIFDPLLHLSLGKAGGNLCATYGLIPYATDGIASVPLPNVTV